MTFMTTRVLTVEGVTKMDNKRCASVMECMETIRGYWREFYGLRVDDKHLRALYIDFVNKKTFDVVCDSQNHCTNRPI